MIGMRKRNLSLLLLILLGMPAILATSRVLSLDSCRTLAVENNKDLRKSEMEMKAAYYNRKSAFTNYLPKVSASGIYMHTGKELSLLSDEQKATLSSVGDALSIPALNQVGQGLVDALRTDTRNMAGAAVMLTQPVYMGGKIRAYNNITRYAEKIASDKHRLEYQELIVDVDETYWNIVVHEDICNAVIGSENFFDSHLFVDSHYCYLLFKIIFIVGRGGKKYSPPRARIRFYSAFEAYLTAASMKPVNSGCALSGRDLNSGWNCTATNHGWFATSTISIRPRRGFQPVKRRPVQHMWLT